MLDKATADEEEGGEGSEGGEEGRGSGGDKDGGGEGGSNEQVLEKTSKVRIAIALQETCMLSTNI